MDKIAKSVRQALLLAAMTACILGCSSVNKSVAFPINIRQEFDLPTPGAAVAVAWSPDGSHLAAVSNYGGDFTVWDREGHVIKKFERHGGGPTLEGSLAFVNGASQLVFPPPETSNNSTAFAVWDVATGEIIRTEDGPQPGDDYPLNRADHFMTTPDQRLLMTATRAGNSWKDFKKNVTIYDTGTWQVLHTIAISPSISSLCVFADGRLIGLGSIAGGRITVVSVASGAPINEIQAYEESKYGSVSLGAIAGSPAGDLIMVGVGSGLLNGAYMGSPEQHAWEESVNSIEAVRMYRVKDGARVASFNAAKAPIRQAMWDPKGRFVAFVDNERGLFLWAPWNDGRYKKIDLPSKTLSLAVSPGGDRIAVTTERGVRVYAIF